MPTSLRFTCRLIALVIVASLITSCGGGGGSSSSTAPAPLAAAPTVAQLANVCTPAGEKAWIAAYMNDVYLFYRDIVAVDPAAYATQEDYFYALLVRSKDRFSFVEPQSVADAFFTAGQDVGYGGVFKLDATGALRIGFVDAGGPLAVQNVGRGTTITALNGTPTASFSTTQLNTLLFPTSVGVMLSLTLIDAGQTVPRTITIASMSVTENPVPLARVLPRTSGAVTTNVGYLLFNDQIATSETGLVDAISMFKAANVSDVVIDLRYNGGGFLYIASELAYMLGGSRITPGAAFESLQYNDKHPEKNATQFFLGVSQSGVPLPTLNLPRVFVLTSPSTCSASESVINGLTPFLQVVLVGGTTCGKPYGFVQANNCGDAFFAIQFQGVNSVGFGAYTNGFTPTCPVADDFSRALGDPAEGRFAAALAYAGSGSCPAASVTPNAVVHAVSRDDVPAPRASDGDLGRADHRMRLVR